MKNTKKGLYYVVTSAIFILFLIPFYIVIVNAFKGNKEIISNALSLPKELNVSAIVDAFQKMNYIQSFGNSLVITLISVVITIIVAAMCLSFSTVQLED